MKTKRDIKDRSYWMHEAGLAGVDGISSEWTDRGPKDAADIYTALGISEFNYLTDKEEEEVIELILNLIPEYSERDRDYLASVIECDFVHHNNGDFLKRLSPETAEKVRKFYDYRNWNYGNR